MRAVFKLSSWISIKVLRIQGVHALNGKKQNYIKITVVIRPKNVSLLLDHTYSCITIRPFNILLCIIKFQLVSFISTFFALKNNELGYIDFTRLPKLPMAKKKKKKLRITWVLIGRTDAKAETPVLWPPHVKS